jgi:hypothetical protein
MRALRLAQAAAEAEALRLRYRARRAARGAIFIVVSLGFFGSAIGFAHLSAWLWLQPWHGGAWAALIIAGADFVIALAILLLSARSRPAEIEREARRVRDRALDGMTRPASILSMLGPVAEVIALWRRGRHDGGGGKS